MVIDLVEGIVVVFDLGFGGIDVFIGKVCDVNIGWLVIGIIYDLFELLVLNEFKCLVVEVEVMFGLKLKLYVVYVKGWLGIGDVVVVVVVGSLYCDEVFCVCW